MSDRILRILLSCSWRFWTGCVRGTSERDGVVTCELSEGTRRPASEISNDVRYSDCFSTR